jgi:hypothetical protein
MRKVLLAMLLFALFCLSLPSPFFAILDLAWMPVITMVPGMLDEGGFWGISGFHIIFYAWLYFAWALNAAMSLSEIEPKSDQTRVIGTIVVLLLLLPLLPIYGSLEGRFTNIIGVFKWYSN